MDLDIYELYLNAAKQLQKDIKKELVRVTRTTIIPLIYNEAVNMYDSMIRQFYTERKPDYYRRTYEMWNGHDITKTGCCVNLDFDGTRMDQDAHEHDDSTTVLIGIMAGVRGVIPYWYEYWTPTYTSAFFSYTGRSMVEAYEQFVMAAEQYAAEVMQEAIENIF